MNVFELRDRLTADYGSYVRGFINVRNGRISDLIEHEFEQGLLWPDPLIQMNPSFEHGGTVEDLVAEGVLHSECSRIFRLKRLSDPESRPLRLHRHQADAIRIARDGHNYVLTTGTGSGKSLTYIIPIVDHVLRRGSGIGITAVVVYPMNALANSQLNELQRERAAKLTADGQTLDHTPRSPAQIPRRYHGRLPF
ncbi:MAG: DEAD/DEAH box helicase [Acidobacteriota bacterium]